MYFEVGNKSIVLRPELRSRFPIFLYCLSSISITVVRVIKTLQPVSQKSPRDIKTFLSNVLKMDACCTHLGRSMPKYVKSNPAVWLDWIRVPFGRADVIPFVVLVLFIQGQSGTM